MSDPSPPTPGRRVLTWLASLVGGALFLWLASTRLRLWPDDLRLPAPELVALALAVHVPYGLTRAMRLHYLLDPVVAAAAPAPDSGRLRRSVLYGSGFVSFLVLLVLPLKLGELSRPLLLARAREPGVGLAEALAAVATERIIDGLVICGMLFGGLAAVTELGPEAAAHLGDVRAIGQAMMGLFVLGLLVLVLAARAPERMAALVRRVPGPLGARAAALLVRVAEPVRPLLHARCAIPLLGWSIFYWAITTFQLWLVLRGCGVHLGPAASMAVVAIVGLSIQLPGGPAQAGTFQIGASVALGLFLTPEQLQGPGSAFAAVMYVLQFVGAAMLAVPGLWLLRRSAA
ncbi:lysylphosphatidylglycerol synthase transmembrane domain-containing protein [Paraliomyxa miuraensis]|uniref:lysylphosphatidylglycerol synthase transmembrane domain-containing protein n=1 Tax=Paraliomyxa miuraensis TaxID=376150 RepID=UPI00225C1CA4|nr:lysylphosphatidylglycerol synthase transmembrane domain-containing protein [Paraliomyxa miuraensis]MCX4243837.1 flippase-like domain-containing protein [Paraliomyxa miuraensis]